MDSDGDFAYDTFEYLVYDGADVALAFDGAGSLTTRYLNGPAVDQILAEETRDESGELIDVLHMLADHQGSVRDVANNTGTVVDHILYDSYGNASGDDPDVQNTYGYAGYFIDSETGLARSWGRWYDPATGRWTGEDPSKDGTNWQIYVGASPTNFIDPNGQEARWFNDDWTDWVNPFAWGADIADRVRYEFITRHENRDAENAPEPTGPPPILGSEPEAPPAMETPAPCPVPEERPLRAGSVPDGDDRRREFAQQLERDANNAAEFTANTLGGSVEAQRQLFSGKSITGRPLTEAEKTQAAITLGLPLLGMAFGRLSNLGRAAGHADEAEECVEDAAKAGKRSLPAPSAVLNKRGVPYPTVIDPRTGRAVSFPETIVRTPKASRVPWNDQARDAFIGEWRRRGFADPSGGWENYDIHHIQPREWGGTNAFENLVPIERGVHQQTVTPWWNNFSGR